MSEIKKIGMYSTDEILRHLTEGEGRGFLGRSIFDAIYFKTKELENINEKLSLALNSVETELQQKENIIREVREYIEPIVELDNDIMLKGKMLKPVLEILDKANEKEDK